MTPGVTGAPAGSSTSPRRASSPGSRHSRSARGAPVTVRVDNRRLLDPHDCLGVRRHHRSGGDLDAVAVLAERRRRRFRRGPGPRSARAPGRAPPSRPRLTSEMRAGRSARSQVSASVAPSHSAIGRRTGDAFARAPASYAACRAAAHDMRSPVSSRGRRRGLASSSTPTTRQPSPAETLSDPRRATDPRRGQDRCQHREAVPRASGGPGQIDDQRTAGHPGHPRDSDRGGHRLTGDRADRLGDARDLVVEHAPGHLGRPVGRSDSGATAGHHQRRRRRRPLARSASPTGSPSGTTTGSPTSQPSWRQALDEKRPAAVGVDAGRGAVGRHDHPGPSTLGQSRSAPKGRSCRLPFG